MHNEELEQMKQHGDPRASEVVELSQEIAEAMRRSKASAEKVQKALMKLVIDKPFFGSLALRLKVEPDRRGHPTLWTDARVLRYNPEFVYEANFDHLVAAMAKCVAHCALRHPFRRGARNPELWSKATSQVALELLMKDEGFSFHPSAWGDMDDRFSNMTAEQVYEVLLSEQPPSPSPQDQQQQAQTQQPSSSKPQQQEQQGGGGNSNEGEQQPESKGEQQSSPQSGRQGDQSASPQSSEKQPEKDAENASNTGSDERNQGSGGQAPKDQNQNGSANPDEPSNGSKKTDPSGSPDSGKSSSSEQQSSEEQQPGPSLADSPGNPMGDSLDAGTSGRGEEEQESEDPQQDESAAPPLSEAEMREAEEDWEAAASAAAVQAEVAGNLASAALRSIRDSFQSNVAYREYLRMFVAATTREDQNWGRPSRRSQAAGVYLPEQRTESAGILVLGIDTSGSIDEAMLSRWQSEFGAVVSELRPPRIVLMYCDALVHAVQDFYPGDPIEFDPKKLIGGGGTKFGPVFQRATEMHEAGERVAGLIYLTDLLGKFPQDEPPFPTLWVQTGSRQRGAPFGEVCWIGNV